MTRVAVVHLVLVVSILAAGASAVAQPPEESDIDPGPAPQTPPEEPGADAWEAPQVDDAGGDDSGPDMRSEAGAGATRNVSPFRVRPELEIPITLGLFALVGTTRLFPDELVDVPCGAMCDRNTVNVVDRWVIGQRSTEWALVSDISFATTIIAPFAIGAFDTWLSEPDDGWVGYLEDALVLLETFAFVTGMNNLLSFIVRRPRPLAYDPAVPVEERTDGNSALSFPSGHVSAGLALGIATTRIFAARHPDQPELTILIGVALHTLPVLTGIGRMLSQNHFLTDVLVGAAFGEAAGLLIPWLHEHEGAPALSAAAMPGGGMVAATFEM